MRKYAVRLQNVPYSKRLPFINLLRNRGERIFEFSSIYDKNFIYATDICFSYNEEDSCWVASPIFSPHSTISIQEFISLHSLTLKEL